MATIYYTGQTKIKIYYRKEIIIMEYKLRKAIEEKDWFIEKDGENWILSKFTPAGEDYFFTIRNSNILEDVKEEFETFDADEHVDMWIPHRGTYGVPTSVRTLIEDAEKIKDYLSELYTIVEKYYGKTETRTESSK